MTYTQEQARADVLGLLLAGATPEEAEAWLEERFDQEQELTALSDPTNVLMEEVASNGARSG